MKLLKTFGNPMALVTQGFLVGATLFFATHPETGRDLAAAALSAVVPSAAAQSAR